MEVVISKMSFLDLYTELVKLSCTLSESTDIGGCNI